MDVDRFDALSRALIAPRSRRLTLGALLGVPFGFLGLTDTQAKRTSRKCKPTCIECNSCKNGKCHKKHGKKRCKKGRCQPTADGTACTGGTCCGGICTNLQTDEANCGGCGMPCRPNRVCQAGACFPTGACPATTSSICAADATACSEPVHQCACSRSAEGNALCMTIHDVACPGIPCTTSAECAANWACVDVSGCCTPDLPAGTKWCMIRCPAPIPM